jgi:hypothetical protein
LICPPRRAALSVADCRLFQPRSRPVNTTLPPHQTHRAAHCAFARWQCSARLPPASVRWPARTGVITTVCLLPSSASVIGHRCALTGDVERDGVGATRMRLQSSLRS